MTAPLTDQQLTAIEAAIRSVIPGVKDSNPVRVHIAESDDVNGLVNSWTAPSSSLAVRINDRLSTELDRAQRAYIFDTAELKRDNDRLRADLEQAQAVEQRLAALFASGQHWTDGRLVSEHIWTCHEIRTALEWPEPTAETTDPATT